MSQAPVWNEVTEPEPIPMKNPQHWTFTMDKIGRWSGTILSVVLVFLTGVLFNTFLGSQNFNEAAQTLRDSGRTIEASVLEESPTVCQSNGLFHSSTPLACDSLWKNVQKNGGGTIAFKH